MSNLLPSRGRAGTLLMMTVDRELTPADFANAAANPGDHIGPSVIQKLHNRHHRAARLIAEGKSHADVAFETGYTAQRISDLTRDPAFAELTARYHASITDSSLDAAKDAHTTLVDVFKTSVEEIRDRLEDDAKRSQIPMSELRQVAQFAADRTIAPPKVAQPTGTIPPRITFNIGTRDIRPIVTVEQDGSPVIEVTSDDSREE
jgi:hypothetical protein